MENSILGGNFLLNATGKIDLNDENLAGMCSFFYMIGASVTLEAILAPETTEGVTDMIVAIKGEIDRYMKAIGSTSTRFDSLDEALLAVQSPVGGVN